VAALLRRPVRAIDAETRLCAVIGHPVRHSLSPQIHNAAFEAAGLNYAYLAFEVKDLAGCLAGLRSMDGFRGLSVTIPHKEAVIPLLDEVDPVARRIGSVNTITRDEQGRLSGRSTDGPGTLRAFEDSEVPLAGKRVLFLGAGGAVRAVAFAMMELAGVGQITLLGRTAATVERLAGDLRAVGLPCAIGTGAINDGLREAVAAHDVIVNGTPMGMYPEYVGRTLVDSGMLKPEHTVFDMVYRPLETRLVTEARAAGAKVISGLDMLVNQAALQFEHWTGVDAPRRAMWDAALAALGTGR